MCPNGSLKSDDKIVIPRSLPSNPWYDYILKASADLEEQRIPAQNEKQWRDLPPYLQPFQILMYFPRDLFGTAYLDVASKYDHDTIFWVIKFRTGIRVPYSDLSRRFEDASKKYVTEAGVDEMRREFSEKFNEEDEEALEEDFISTFYNYENLTLSFFHQCLAALWEWHRRSNDQNRVKSMMSWVFQQTNLVRQVQVKGKLSAAKDTAEVLQIVANYVEDHVGRAEVVTELLLPTVFQVHASPFRKMNFKEIAKATEQIARTQPLARAIKAAEAIGNLAKYYQSRGVTAPSVAASNVAAPNVAAPNDVSDLPKYSISTPYGTSLLQCPRGSLLASADLVQPLPPTIPWYFGRSANYDPSRVHATKPAALQYHGLPPYLCPAQILEYFAEEMCGQDLVDVACAYDNLSIALVVKSIAGEDVHIDKIQRSFEDTLLHCHKATMDNLPIHGREKSIADFQSTYRHGLLSITNSKIRSFNTYESRTLAYFHHCLAALFEYYCTDSQDEETKIDLIRSLVQMLLNHQSLYRANGIPTSATNHPEPSSDSESPIEEELSRLAACVGEHVGRAELMIHMFNKDIIDHVASSWRRNKLLKLAHRIQQIHVAVHRKRAQTTAVAPPLDGPLTTGPDGLSLRDLYSLVILSRGEDKERVMDNVWHFLTGLPKLISQELNYLCYILKTSSRK